MQSGPGSVSKLLDLRPPPPQQNKENRKQNNERKVKDIGRVRCMDRKDKIVKIYIIQYTAYIHPGRYFR